MRRATEVVFPNGSLGLVEGIYKNHPIADYFNELVAEGVVSFVQERLRQDATARIRILEVGAGTGGSSARIFARLAPYREHIEEYCYTDLSQAFLQHAEQAYGPDAPYLSTRIFNLEKPFLGQGLAAGSYDIVVAANVVHATRNIRHSLRHLKTALRTNGVLLLNEINGKNLFVHLTFGLLEGWWLYEDEALREPGCPGLSARNWCRVLQQEGYRQLVLPASNVELGYQVIAAESDGVVRQSLPQASSGKIKFQSPQIRDAVKGLPITDLREAGWSLLDRARASLVQHVARLIKARVDDIDVESELSEYGLDSIGLTQLSSELNQSYQIELTPAIFFEHPTLEKLARYLVSEHQSAFAKLLPSSADPVTAAPAVVAGLGSAEKAAAVNRGRRGRSVAREIAVPRQRTPDEAEPIAIIGMSGRFPMAEDVAAFWRNLAGGRGTASSRSRSERWDWEAVYGDPLKEANKTNIKWGGFIDGVDEFDPLFFGISPREAELMDPQQRLLMSYVWKAIEDAGYSASRFGQPDRDPGRESGTVATAD